MSIPHAHSGTAEERAAEETVMWNEKLMRQEAGSRPAEAEPCLQKANDMRFRCRLVSCHAEARRLLGRQANLLDDTSYEDQLQQQLIFFSFSGIERMVPRRKQQLYRMGS